LKIKAIFCQVIREGSASDVRRFYYWFKNHLESPLYPVLKGPFENHVAQSLDEDPIMILAVKNDIELLDYVLSLKPDMDVTYCDHTALHYAVMGDNTTAIAMFLYHGFDPDVTITNIRPVSLARTAEMKGIFEDFKQLPREEFAAKYKLKIECNSSQKISSNSESPQMVQHSISNLALDVQHEILNHVSIETAFAAQFVCKDWRNYEPHKRAIEKFPYLCNVKFAPTRNSGETYYFRISPHFTVFHFVMEYDLIYDASTTHVGSEEYYSLRRAVESNLYCLPNTNSNLENLSQFIFNEIIGADVFSLKPAFSREEPKYPKFHAIYLEISPYFGLGLVFSPTLWAETYKDKLQNSPS
jgi:hypothetical protein